MQLHLKNTAQKKWAFLFSGQRISVIGRGKGEGLEGLYIIGGMEFQIMPSVLSNRRCACSLESATPDVGRKQKWRNASAQIDIEAYTQASYIW